MNKDTKVTNLFDFCRLYTLLGIPIIEFIIFYLTFYFINAQYVHKSHCWVLICTLLFVIVFNIVVNEEFRRKILFR